VEARDLPDFESPLLPLLLIAGSRGEEELEADGVDDWHIRMNYEARCLGIWTAFLAGWVDASGI
jgi:hypothetical protein